MGEEGLVLKVGMSTITMFIDGTPETITLARSLLSCIRSLGWAGVVELVNPVVPKRFAAGRIRVDAFIIESPVTAIDVAIALVSFSNTLFRFRSTLPRVFAKIPRTEKKKPILVVVGGKSLLLPASTRQQHEFFQQIRSTKKRSSAKKQRKKHTRRTKRA